MPPVESFHGRLREECLRVSWFQNLFDARRKIAAWRRDYNEQRPHSNLKYLTPAEFAATAGGGKGAGQARLKSSYMPVHVPIAESLISSPCRHSARQTFRHPKSQKRDLEHPVFVVGQMWATGKFPYFAEQA